MVELWAIFLGINISSHLSLIRNLEVETDSTQALDLLLHLKYDFHPMSTLIDILSLRNQKSRKWIGNKTLVQIPWLKREED